MGEERPLSGQRFLVTGALGCIGAWTVRSLVGDGASVTVYDMATDLRRLHLIMSPAELAQVQSIAGDVTDLAGLERALAESGAQHIIHLAGLQIPSCRADPALGARVNVVGTVNVFEAAKRTGLRRVVYASSAAVYGISEEYPAGPLPHDAPLRPRSHYGVYKQANEGTARVYWLDDKISSIGLRPYVVYGPGRDQGLTAGPTWAMLAAAAGKPYHIAFGGRCDLQFVADVARTFIHATQARFEGADVFNLRGSVMHMREVVAAVEAAAPGIRGLITFADTPLPLPEEMDSTPMLAALGPLPHTSLAAGVARSIGIFRKALADGRIAEPTAA